MNYVIEFLFVFAFCCTAGWLLEVVYRSVGQKHFVNPGFLAGCCLPIYGTGGLALYLLCLPINQINSMPLRILTVFAGGAVIMTLIELIGGGISLKFYHMRLWDYSDKFLNFKGLICLQFTIYWGLCCIGFYFLIYPWLSVIAANALSGYGWVLCVGFYYGIFAVDLVESMHLAKTIKEHAVALSQIIDVEKLKMSARETLNKYRTKPKKHFMFQHGSLKEYLYGIKKSALEKTAELREKTGEVIKKR